MGTSGYNPATDPANQPFQNDLTNLMNDCNGFYQAEQAYYNENSNAPGAVQQTFSAFHNLFSSPIANKNSKEYNPELVIQLFMIILLNQGQNQAYDNQVVMGYKTKIQGDFTRLFNDVQSLTTSTATGTTGQNTVSDAASDLSQLSDILSTPGEVTTNDQTWYQYAYQSLGTGINQNTGVAGAQLLKSSVLSQRQLFDVSNDPFANDNKNGSYNGASTTAYFNPEEGTGKLHTFNEMIQGMSQPGDPKQAAQAGQKLSTGAQELTATTGSIGSALTQLENQLTVQIKSLQAAASSGLHSHYSLESTANRNMTR